MNKYIAILGLCLVLIFTAAGCGGNGSSTSNGSNLESEKQTAVAVVHSAAAGLGAILNDYPDETARINFIRTYIDPIRFYPDNSGYFYVYNLDCVNIAHAIQKDLQGQNLYNYQDSRGNYVIRLLSVAAKNGGGFVEYYWVNPTSASKEEQKKIGYVEPIPGTDYFIGTGVYMNSGTASSTTTTSAPTTASSTTTATSTSTAVASDTIFVDKTYDGKTVKMAPGGLLQVALDSNPSTGFRWDLTGISDSTVLEKVSNTFDTPAYKLPAGATPPVGAGGTEFWNFKALKKGTSTLSMEYSRPWAGGEKGAQEFTLTVSVE